MNIFRKILNRLKGEPETVETQEIIDKPVVIEKQKEVPKQMIDKPKAVEKQAYNPRKAQPRFYPASSGNRLACKYQDRHVCNCDVGQEDAVRKDFYELLNNGTDIETIRSTLRGKYNKHGWQRKKKTQPVAKIPVANPRDRFSCNKVSKSKTRYHFKVKPKKGKKITVCYIEKNEFDIAIDHYLKLEKQGLSFDDIKIEMKKRFNKPRGGVKKRKVVCNDWSCLKWNKDGYLYYNGKNTLIRPSYFSTIETLHANRNYEFGFTEVVYQQMRAFNDNIKCYDVVDFMCQHYTDREFRELRDAGLKVMNNDK